MPVAAAGGADVVAADLDPLEVLWRRFHLAQQLAVGGLEPVLLGQGQARVGDAVGELVAQPLQLTEVEQPRRGRDRGDAVTDLDPAEALGEEPGKLPLQGADLAPQLTPRGTLVDIDAKSREAVS